GRCRLVRGGQGAADSRRGCSAVVSGEAGIEAPGRRRADVATSPHELPLAGRGASDGRASRRRGNTATHSGRKGASVARRTGGKPNSLAARPDDAPASRPRPLARRHRRRRGPLRARGRDGEAQPPSGCPRPAVLRRTALLIRNFPYSPEISSPVLQQSEPLRGSNGVEPRSKLCIFAVCTKRTFRTKCTNVRNVAQS